MHIPRCIPPLEMNSSITSCTISYRHVWSPRHSTAPLRSAFALPSRGGHARRVPPSAFGDFSSRWPRSVISEDHLWEIVHASVAELCILKFPNLPKRSNRGCSYFMHILIIDHAVAIHALPIRNLAHSSSPSYGIRATNSCLGFSGFLRVSAAIHVHLLSFLILQYNFIDQSPPLY